MISISPVKQIQTILYLLEFFAVTVKEELKMADDDNSSRTLACVQRFNGIIQLSFLESERLLSLHNWLPLVLTLKDQLVKLKGPSRQKKTPVSELREQQHRETFLFLK